MEPKFKPGQLVRYRVKDEVRYNHILEPVWNKHANCYLYKLNEPMAIPVYREQWLEEVSEDDVKRLQKAVAEARCWLSKRGYLYTKVEDKHES